MRRLASTICSLILGIGLVLGCAPPIQAAPTELQGSWTATKAERDGKAADDVVGHRLTFVGNRFRIRSKTGKTVYAGTVQTDPSAKPATIDFVLRRQTWKGIYVLDGDTLITCDNAPDRTKSRPAAFEAKQGSGYVLVTFTRAR